MILEARKGSEEQSLQKNKCEKKKKRARKKKANRKSQKLFKPKGKSKKPIALKTKRKG